jgi:restriction system protein
MVEPLTWNKGTEGMARKYSSPLEDFVDIVAMMPWWVGLLLAAVLYLGFSYYASQPLAPIAYSPGHPPDVVSHVLKGLVGMLKYALPILAVVGSLISLFKRIKRGSLFNAATDNGKNFIDGVSWQEFELLVGESFRKKGYVVDERCGGGADGGVDLVLYKDGEKSLVQCKQWRAYKVGVTVVRELYGVMAAEGAASGYVVTSGRFTAEAKKFASGREIALIDGATLSWMIREVKKQSKTVLIPSVQTVPKVGNPACPVCSGKMEMRTARKRKSAGTQFWGCARYPTCKGTRNLY